MNGFLNSLIGIGRATQVDDEGDLQMVQVTEGARGTGGTERITDKVRRVTEFGFTSVPPLDAVVTMLRRGGERSRSIIFGSAHAASRPRGLKPGDTAVYDVRGARITLTADGLKIDCAGLPAIIENASTITLKASAKVVIDAPVAEFTGTVSATGEITARKGGEAAALGALRDAYNGHKHGLVKAGTDTSDVTDKKA